MHRIADDQRQRIGEDGRGLIERPAVLAMVRSGLARVPAESHTRKCMTLNEGDDKSRPSRIHGFAASPGGQAIPLEQVLDEIVPLEQRNVYVLEEVVHDLVEV